jgi:hypothetical protein
VTLTGGWNVLAGDDKGKILTAVLGDVRRRQLIEDTAEKMVKIILCRSKNQKDDILCSHPVLLKDLRGSITEYFGSGEMLNYKLNAQGGFTPARLWLSQCDNPRTGTTSSSLSAGAVRENRLMSPPSSYQHAIFHIIAIGIRQNRIFSELIPTTGSYEDFLPEGIMACIES